MRKLLYQPVWMTLFTLLLVCLDQATKGLAVRFLQGREPYVIWDGVLELRYLENRGAAFGMLQGQRGLFLLIGVLVFAAVLYLFRHMSGDERFLPIRLIALCILAGAWGNMIDRLWKGYVVDFIYFSLIDFPIFNVADIYVSLSTAAMVILILFHYKDEELNGLLVKKEKQS